MHTVRKSCKLLLDLNLHGQEGEVWKSFVDDVYFVVVIINMMLSYNFMLYDYNFMQ